MTVPLMQQLDVAGKRVLVRVDFNVPLTKEGAIRDDTRIKSALPTIAYLLEKGAKVILVSHLGRPDGKVNRAFSLKPCAERLASLLGRPVLFSEGEGELLLLENVRFHPEEEKGDVSFAKKLASLADVYINDAFGTAHRAHASTATVAQFFPGRRAAGFLLQKEIAFLDKLLKECEHPFYAIIGGAKVSTKLGVLKALLTKADLLFIGGAMSYTFLRAKGVSVGRSLVEESRLQEASSLLASGKIVLPLDHIVSDGEQVLVVEDHIPEGFAGMDIGPRTLAEWGKQLRRAKTLFWNGPVGVCEEERFAAGTKGIAKFLAEAKVTTIVGGGDSVSAVENQGLTSKFSHISTGGGASLEYLEKGTLPGIEALK